MNRDMTWGGHGAHLSKALGHAQGQGLAEVLQASQRLSPPRFHARMPPPGRRDSRGKQGVQTRTITPPTPANLPRGGGGGGGGGYPPEAIPQQHQQHQQHGATSPTASDTPLSTADDMMFEVMYLRAQEENLSLRSEVETLLNDVKLLKETLAVERGQMRSATPEVREIIKEVPVEIEVPREIVVERIVKVCIF